MSSDPASPPGGGTPLADISITDGLPPEHLSKSERLSKSIEGSLQTLRQEICSREVQRTTSEVKIFGQQQYAKVTIRAPQRSELDWAQNRLLELATEVSAESRPYLLSDGRKLIDSYLHFIHPFTVVIVSMPLTGNPGGGPFKQDGLGMYWVFHTVDPAAYKVSDQLQADGTRISVPPNVTTMDTRPWYDSRGRQPLRYRHLFQGL